MQKKALEGIKILDFSQLLAGPFATMMLADMGAEVIKIERVDVGDDLRRWTFFNQYFEDGTSPCYMAWNRNKKSMAINIKDEKAKEIIYKMVEDCDVVTENFRPGVMDKLGYGYETLIKINPKLVYASNSGFGSSGPYVSRPGQDMLIQGLVGLTTLTGRKDSPPVPLGTGLPDMLSSFHMVYGILSALIYSMKTGKGQHVEVDLMRSAMALESQEFMTLLNLPVQYTRPDSGIAHPFQKAPFGIYQCKDGYIAIARCVFASLVEVLEKPDLMKYNDSQIQFEKRDEVFYAIEEVTKMNTVSYWVEKMLAVDIWVAPIVDITQVEHNEQVKHMESITSFTHEKAGKVRCVAPAVSMSETPPEIYQAPPGVGEHTIEILKAEGLSDDTIKVLIEKKIISI